MEVAVIGAGFSGLTAAYRLAQGGARVTLYERGEGVGGLVSDFRLHGANVEKAYHFICRTDRHLQDMIAELGLAGRLSWRTSQMACYFRDRIYPFSTAPDLLRFTPLPPLDRLRAGLTVLWMQRMKSGWRKLRGMTAEHWLRRNAGKAVYDVIWAPLLKGKFGDQYHTVCMPWLWARVKQRADGKRPGDQGETLGALAGGFHTITSGLAERILAAGGRIQTSTSVARIASDGGGVRVELGDGKGAERFDRVLFTGPSPVFGRLIAGNAGLPAGYLEQLDSIPYLGAVSLVFTSPQEISPYFWHNISEMDWPFLVVIVMTHIRDRAEFGGHHLYYIAAYVPHEHEYFTMPEAALKDQWFSALARMFPAFDRSQVREEHLFRLRYAQHVVGVAYEERIPAYRTPVPGVYLANFSQIYPYDRGTTWAIRDGSRVARLILADA